MAKRINIVLPEETVEVLERVAKKGERSRLISEAVLYYVNSKAKANLEDQLKEGAKAYSTRDLSLAEDWFSLEDEAWQPKKKKGSKK